MKIQLIFVLFVVGLAVSGAAAGEPEVDEGVLVLTKDNFDATVKNNDHVLVMFYAPWCGHCKRMKPEYSAAALQLAADGSPIKIGKVDATQENDLAAKFGVRGYPTLKFFVNGEAIDFNGPREKAGILKWLAKKTQPSTVLLADKAAAEKAKTDNEVVVVFFGEEGSAAFETWSKVTLSFDDLTFSHVFDKALAKEFGVEGTGVVLFKQFDEGRNDFDGEFTVENVKQFVDANKLRTIMKFDQGAAQLIFGGPKDAIILFVDADGAASNSAFEQLTAASSELKGKIVLSYSGPRDGMDATLQGRLDDYLGVTGDRPQAWIVSPKGNDIAKFQFEGDFTTSPEGFLSFFADFKAGKLSKKIKSEPVPESQDSPVIKVVALNWEEIVNDSTKDVLVKYYAPWCGHCKSVSPFPLP